MDCSFRKLGRIAVGVDIEKMEQRRHLEIKGPWSSNHDKLRASMWELEFYGSASWSTLSLEAMFEYVMLAIMARTPCIWCTSNYIGYQPEFMLEVSWKPSHQSLFQ
ncbi:hypothetical protein BDV36DRAFT_247345 [Aspergillus pseudocaelatus]|uniref:Uncharacterized protein n=1 Tax=Aspergillus pseudocaelatus TaxID=1825620 RepID=A0ABQ6WXA4_9EURO|nr:hypothetical protein BDV36DRAFT_247345 [Aspergillus pseudocaelatus]